MVMVTMRHARLAGLCSRGCRQFALENNLDWMEFLNNGLPSETLLALNSVFCDECVRIAEKEEQDGRR